jgi:hypothetical protein
MLVLLFCNAQVPFSIDLVVIFELVLLLHIGVIHVSLVGLVFLSPFYPMQIKVWSTKLIHKLEVSFFFFG